MGLISIIKIISGLIILISTLLNIYIYQFDRILTCKWEDSTSPIKILAFGDPQITGTNENTTLRKKLDVYGNDYFLGHIYNVLKNHLQPNHIAVMGDLISNQWVGDDEFYRRAERYKNRIFTTNPENFNEPIFINISGNHDIGYNGEMTHERINRYQEVYGKVNYLVESNNQHPKWRYIVINSLSLDGPALNPEFQDETLNFIKSIQETDFQGPTILFTHVPLYKKEPICKDSTFFNYYPWGTLREQNHLSQETTQLLLNSIFGSQNPYGGVILTGHDHEGCITDYEYDLLTDEWVSSAADVSDTSFSATPIIREITVRSMMGEFGGNGGILNGYFDSSKSIWRFSFNLCTFGLQHIWWATKITTYISLIIITIWTVLAFVY